ncbi:MAG: ASKHA domain-containing protein [Nitrososphaeria archaeon]
MPIHRRQYIYPIAPPTDIYGATKPRSWCPEKLSKTDVTITFQPIGRRVRIDRAETVLEASRTAGITIRNVCGGKGICGKCRAIVKNGNIDFRVPRGEKLLSDEELSRGYVLACQTRCLSDCEVLIPPESRIEGQQILSKAQIFKVKPNPSVSREYLDPQFLSRAITDVDLEAKISGFLRSRYSGRGEVIFSPFISSRLKELSGQFGRGLTVTVRKKADSIELVDLELGDRSSRNFGLAVDIGTTKIVAYLVNLVTGEILDVASDYNKQLMYGEDVVSRIGFTVDQVYGTREVQEAAVNTVNQLIRTLSQRNQVHPREIIDVTVAGNTVMSYLFAGMDSAPLLHVNAFVPKHSIKMESKMLGVDVNPWAMVHFLPCVSRFLGGDAVGDILLSRMHESQDISLLIDIGTNAEVILGSQGWLLSTSAAAGPAFEGWGIKFGTRSVEGAIERIKIDPETLKASYTLIGSAKPKGICGSGLIDAMAEMFRVGILDSFGKIHGNLPPPFVRKGSDGLEYVVSPSRETSIGQDIVITQKDVDILMDSKASACGAISVLIKKMRLTVEDIKNVYVCGAFGSFLDLNSAVAIGLLPEFPNAKHLILGNGSAAGAYLALVSLDYRKKAEEIAELTTYFDMLQDMDFMDEYLAAFVLPGKKELFPHWWEASRRLTRKT